MSRVITFSKVFPKGHIYEGIETDFVEKIITSMVMRCGGMEYNWNHNIYNFNNYNYNPKGHTIRKGKRWKVGDKFSPRIWSVKPYCSKQIIIGDDIEIKKIFDITIFFRDSMYGGRSIFVNIDGKPFTDIGYLAYNDGLNISNFASWFNKSIKKGDTFQGQIICWDANINY